MKRIGFSVAILLCAACSDDSNGSGDGSADAGRTDGTIDSGRIIVDFAVPDAAPDAAPDVLALDGPLPDGPLPDAAEPDLGVVVFDIGVPDAFPDAIVRDPACAVPPVIGEQPAIDLEARCTAPGDPLRIRDLRDSRCPKYEVLPERAPGREFELTEAVVTGIYGNDFTIQDPEGGAWSGAFVYSQFVAIPDELRVGSRVSIEAQVIEFFSLTEIIINNDSVITIVEQGEAPEPLFIADASTIADEGALAEPLQSVLVEVRDVRVTGTAPDCPRDFGMFVLTGGLRVDDDAPYDFAPSKNDIITRMVGPTSYTFGHFKILPRGDADIEFIECGGIPDKCEATPCPVEEDALETGVLIITEIQDNPRGDDELREFVELYNPSPVEVVLDGWRVQDCAGNEAPLSGSVGPRGYYVLSRSLDEDENGGVDAQAEFGDLFLPNAFGSVLVFDNDNRLVDQVRYEPGGEVWPDRRAGQSLELIEPAADNRLGGAWAAGSEDYGEGGRGTPGGPYED